MKKASILLLIGLFLLVANISMATEDPKGFRGLMWGTDFSTVKEEMVYIRTDSSYGGIQFYSRKNDEMAIGTAELFRIEYGFWQNKFIAVSIMFQGFSNFNSLKGSVFERFGAGYQSNRYIEEYYWHNFAETTISLKYSKVNKKGFCRFLSNEFFRKAEQYQKEKNKEGAKKGF